MSFDFCAKCEATILIGQDQGMKLRLSTLVIPVRQASVLSDWGNSVYTIRLYGRSIVAELWSSSYGESDWLVLAHECGQDAHNWRFHKPKYGPVTRRDKPTPSPDVPGFSEDS